MKNKLKFKIVSAFLCAALTFAGCVSTNDSSSSSEVEKNTMVVLVISEGTYYIMPNFENENITNMKDNIFLAFLKQTYLANRISDMDKL